MSISKIEHNLYTLYRKMASLSANVIQEEQGVSWVNCQPQTWPRTLFGTSSAPLDFSTLVEKIKLGKIPPHWIMLQNKDDILQKKLKENRFRLMNQWSGMALNLSQHDFEHTHTQEVTNLKDLNAWLKVVNQTLFSSNPLDENIMQRVFELDDSIRFYVHKEENKVVSTGLSHDTEDTSGFYMIATLEAYREKGYGTSITQQMLLDAKERKLGTAILQATPMGAKVYTKLGFQQFCIFDIYWLLGIR